MWGARHDIPSVGRYAVPPLACGDPPGPHLLCIHLFRPLLLSRVRPRTCGFLPLPRGPSAQPLLDQPPQGPMRWMTPQTRPPRPSASSPGKPWKVLAILPRWPVPAPGRRSQGAARIRAFGRAPVSGPCCPHLPAQPPRPRTQLAITPTETSREPAVLPRVLSWPGRTRSDSRPGPARDPKAGNDHRGPCIPGAGQEEASALGSSWRRDHSRQRLDLNRQEPPATTCTSQHPEQEV